MINRCLVACAFFLAVPLASGAQDRPRITSFFVDGDNFQTADRTVSLRFTAQGPAATLYRASEHADMSGALWRRIEGTPTFTLSSGNGNKKVYFQVGVALQAPQLTPKSPALDAKAVPTSYVAPPSITSDIVSDDIILGLPDLVIKVDTWPSSVHDGNMKRFSFTLSVMNQGQATAPNTKILFYNSFVDSHFAMEPADVTFGVSRLVGKGCVVTDTPTIECDLAPIPAGGGVQFNFAATVNHFLQTGQNESTVTLRSRVQCCAESNSANNYVNLSLKVVR